MSAYSDSFTLLISIAIIILISLYYNPVETYNDPKILDIKQKLYLVDPEVAGKLNIQAGNVSFTENKKDMYLCLRDEKGQYYPDNMLIYVALHELAHAKSKAVDTKHTGDEFRENFNFYLRKAQELGIFDPNKGIIYNYCGVTPETK